MKPWFDELNSESFNTAAKAVLVSKKEIDTSMRHWFVRLLQEVTTHRYMFDWNEVESKLLEQWIS